MKCTAVYAKDSVEIKMKIRIEYKQKMHRHNIFGYDIGTI